MENPSLKGVIESNQIHKEFNQEKEKVERLVHDLLSSLDKQTQEISDCLKKLTPNKGS